MATRFCELCDEPLIHSYNICTHVYLHLTKLLIYLELLRVNCIIKSTMCHELVFLYIFVEILPPNVNKLSTCTCGVPTHTHTTCIPPTHQFPLTNSCTMNSYNVI